MLTKDANINCKNMEKKHIFMQNLEHLAGKNGNKHVIKLKKGLQKGAYSAIISSDDMERSKYR